MLMENICAPSCSNATMSISLKACPFNFQMREVNAPPSKMTFLCFALPIDDLFLIRTKNTGMTYRKMSHHEYEASLSRITSLYNKIMQTKTTYEVWSLIASFPNQSKNAFCASCSVILPSLSTSRALNFSLTFETSLGDKMETSSS